VSLALSPKSLLEEFAMTFMIQFLRFRRGVLEVVHTLYIDAADGSAALARAQNVVGPSSWPMRIDAMRVFDRSGRKLMNWMVPIEAAQPAQSLGALATV